jgi:hypothetical protein
VPHGTLAANLVIARYAIVERELIRGNGGEGRGPCCKGLFVSKKRNLKNLSMRECYAGSGPAARTNFARCSSEAGQALEPVHFFVTRREG